MAADWRAGSAGSDPGIGKKRFELKDGRIRAFYGHSVPMRIVRGREKAAGYFVSWYSQKVCGIHKSNGLLPQERQYVPPVPETEKQRSGWESGMTANHVFWSLMPKRHGRKG